MPPKQKAVRETPMMQQYWRYRREDPRVPADALLLFRLGDFYEMFHGDAEEGARLLGITLTQRSGYPMAGIPYHARDTYLPKLLNQGVKVAIVDQIETPKPGKLVERDLTRVLTPGTTLEEHQLDARRNHYLLALSSDKKGNFHAAWLDLSTGEFQIASEKSPARLMPLFHAIDPKEILLPENISIRWAHEDNLRAWHEDFDYYCESRPVTVLPDYQFETESGARAVLDSLGVLNLNGFGLEVSHPALGSAGALIAYATDTLCAPPRNLRQIKEYHTGRALLLDPSTLRNLEIFQSSQGGRSGSLINAIDQTVTAAGGRLLEHWLGEPLLDLGELNRRQQAVADFHAEPTRCAALIDLLKGIRDITRILGRLQNRIRIPRELGGIRDTINQIPAIREELGSFSGAEAQALQRRVNSFDDLREHLATSIADELPGNLAEGGVIRDGFDAELDHLRSLTRDSKTWLNQFEADERERSGIKSLKVRYNGAFGYFIELTRNTASQAPADYIRKQTMKNAERYVTEELRQKEKEILHAEEKAFAREESLFQDLVARILEDATALEETASALAQADVFIGWAQLARNWDYCRPELSEDDRLDIEQGRHPVVEQMIKSDRLGLRGAHGFVPNDTLLTAGEEQIALLTGPNMAGKSTYIRQVALIALLAQIGCWVPARRCHVGLVDRIFSRVGASDELARGNSTFMVEMNETANILNNATERSLIILDEIGRGTSTYDGLSIAWAVVEHLHGAGDKGPRTLFATHYHEVTQLENTLPRLRNFSVSVKEWADEIRFIHTVIPGAADRSYGIQVARLAGLPASVIARAKVVLEELESEGNVLRETLREPGKTTSIIKPKQAHASKRPPDNGDQLALF